MRGVDDASIQKLTPGLLFPTTPTKPERGIMSIMASVTSASSPKAIGARVYALRISKGLSQRDIGGPGTSYAYISRIEAGTRNPSIQALIKIAAKLDTTALWLLTGQEERCPVCHPWLK